MRPIAIVALTAVLAASPALAQTAPPQPQSGSGTQRPIDVGPFTPQASGAYMGGGVVLQGAPGAPAPTPTPTPTPPGQIPANAVAR